MIKVTLTPSKLAKIVDVKNFNGLGTQQSKDVVDTVFAAIKQALEDGCKVEIPNVGVLRPVLVPPREIGSFGKKQKVDEKSKIRFKQSRNFGVVPKPVPVKKSDEPEISLNLNQEPKHDLPEDLAQQLSKVKLKFGD